MREQKETMQVSEDEERLLLLLRDMDYGEVVLRMKDGHLDEIAELSRSVMLDR